MLDPEAAREGRPSVGAPLPPAPYLPLAAYRVPAAPATPTWSRAFEVPTARKVVSSGLQLAMDASRPLRRASIYIGLLALGALGPGVLLALVGIARVVSVPSLLDRLLADPTQMFIDNPDIVGPFLLIEMTVGIGVILLSVISIEAQAMAIAILAARASDLPIPLWQAVVRARQVFWRLAGATLLVGIASTIVQLIITLSFIRPFDSNTGVSFIGTAAGSLVVMPFAFAATGVVLGDVGALESLRRSVSLFRARPRIAFVVTMFTLVTSAIESFALGAGADVATRVATVMHLSLDEGVIGPVLVTVLVLTFIVAFGSLTFTIAAIVAAPQVAAFLGLTYYSGGLDRARTPDGARPARFHWVNLPMAITIVGLIALAGFGLPSITSFQP